MPYTSPGSERRWEPEGGVKKHNERIHRESKFVDDRKNLPFTFSKPVKSRKNMDAFCKKCGRGISVSRNTVGIICPSCNLYVSVEEKEELVNDKKKG
jgi:hypothetical protein